MQNSPATSEGPANLSEVEDRAEFAVALTALRDLAGLTVRQVAARSGAQNATLGDWFSGRGLPSKASQPQFLRVLQVLGVEGQACEPWLVALNRVRRPPGPRNRSLVPYRGLARYDINDANWFFGRDEVTAELAQRVEALHQGGGGIHLVIGASGAGKSSVIRAGLIARLRALPGPAPIPLQQSRSDEEPDPAQATGGWKVVLITPSQNAGADLLAGPELLKSSSGRRLLVLDQAEELFTSEAGEPAATGKADATVAALAELAAGPNGAVVVVGLRADFYGHALRHLPLLRAAQTNQTTVGPMSREQLRSAIIEPARRAGVEVEEGLVELLLSEVATVTAAKEPAEAGVLPLLSYALYSTWKLDQGKQLTCRAYRQVKGLHGAIAASADEVYQSLTPSQQRLTRRLFLSLVRLGTDSADTRRVVTSSKLKAELDANQTEFDEVLGRFIDLRLITSDLDSVQCSHEALLTAWPLLCQWLVENRADLILRQQLLTAAQAWQASRHEPHLLYQGTRLAAAQGWAAEHPTEIPALAKRFLQASAKRVRRRTRRLYQLVTLLSLLVVVTCLTSGYAFQQQDMATTQRNEAVSRMMAGRADWLRSHDVALARQLSLAAYRIAPTVEARSSLLDAGATPTVTRLGPFTGAVQTLAYDPQHSLLAAAGVDRTVRLWAMSPGQPPQQLGTALTGPTDTLFSGAFSTDGTVLAVAGADRIIHRWRVDDPTRPQPLPDLHGPTSTVYALLFAPDSPDLLAGTADGQVWTWPAATSAAVPSGTSFKASTAAVQTIGFSPNGQLLVTGGADNIPRIWTNHYSETPVLLSELSGHTGKVLSLAFRTDGRLLATGSGDSTVQIWDLADPTRPVGYGKPLTTNTSWINGLAFSPDGTILAAASSDKSVALYQVSSGLVTQVLPHPAPVTAVIFSGDEHTVATACTDGYLRIWDRPGPLLTGASGGLFSTRFHPGGAILATAGHDEMVRLWDVRDQHHPRLLWDPLVRDKTDDGYAGTLEFSPDGRILAAGTRNGEVDLWEVKNSDRPRRIGTPLTGPKTLIETVAFSGDGSLLAAAGDDGTVLLWQVSDPEHPTPLATIPGTGAIVLSVDFSPSSPVLAVADTAARVQLFDLSDPRQPHLIGQPLSGFSGYAYSVAFSPDGRTLAVGSADKTLRLWRMNGVHPPSPLPQQLLGPTSYVFWVAFHPDGRSIAAASTDGTVWIWNLSQVDRPKVIATLAHSSEAFYTTEFSPDGSVLAAGNSDGTARLWKTDLKQVGAEICATTGVGITRKEWRELAPDVRYDPPCT